jgi:hypothetical protein
MVRYHVRRRTVFPRLPTAVCAVIRRRQKNGYRRIESVSGAMGIRSSHAVLLSPRAAQVRRPQRPRTRAPAALFTGVVARQARYGRQSPSISVRGSATVAALDEPKRNSRYGQFARSGVRNAAAIRRSRMQAQHRVRRSPGRQRMSFLVTTTTKAYASVAGTRRVQQEGRGSSSAWRPAYRILPRAQRMPRQINRVKCPQNATMKPYMRRQFVRRQRE